MSCSNDGRDPAFISTLNPFGWCPTPAPEGCFSFPLPWEGVQYVKEAGRAEVEAEAAKQAPLATKDYTRLFLLLDKYTCVSGFSIRTEEGALKPWEPPAPSLSEYDADPTKYSPPVNSLPVNSTRPAPPMVTNDPPRPSSTVVQSVQLPATSKPATAPPAVELEAAGLGGMSLERLALIAGLIVSGIAIARVLK